MADLPSSGGSLEISFPDPLDFLGFPSLVDDIFLHLFALTAYISQRVAQFLEGVVLQDVYRGLGDSLGEGFVRQTGLSSQSILRSVREECSPFVNSYIANTSCGTCLRRSLYRNEECLVNTKSQFLESSYTKLVASLIFKGLVLPLFPVRLSWRFTRGCWKCTLSVIKCAYCQGCSFASRLQKTLRGSSNDIGWLQYAPGMAPVLDGTGRFLELLEKIRNGEHKLPDSFVYLLIPGCRISFAVFSLPHPLFVFFVSVLSIYISLRFQWTFIFYFSIYFFGWILGLFSNHGPLYFITTKKFFSKMGLACHIAKIHSEASVEHNALELKQYIEELFWGSGKRVMLLGHSKGGVDATAALSLYWSDLQDKVAGLALVQCPYGGTPIASDILREGQIADKETRRIMELLICKLIKGDIRALEDLTYEKRKEFILKHRLPEDIPLISFHSEANIAPGVLATMTHIAHAELPWLPLPMFGCDESENVFQSGRKVPVIIPVSAAMAVCALHLQLRYGEKSDGLVTCRDAEVPGSVVVRPHRKLDHAWMVYSTRKRDPDEPEACEMCEALLTMLVELGKKQQEQREKLEFSK